MQAEEKILKSLKSLLIIANWNESKKRKIDSVTLVEFVPTYKFIENLFIIL